ncbi:hypothetical protein C0583_00955 [Candidatus Parcubacteria bacterium]|nr:MAG: hypothetical protein C0583_00955 [Candidatus Parcubacteria bacterium]
MENLFKKINNKINGVILSFFTTGIVLIIVAILVAWTEFVLRLLVALFILLIAYTFIYASYKLRSIKKEIEKHFKF